MLLLSVVMELTPQLLETQQFPEKWRGYDQDAVDDFLERVGVAVAELQDRLRAANARIEALEASGGTSETPAVAASGALTAEEEAQQVGRALILAQQAADTALEEARAEAARLVAEAESQARALTAEAAGESEQVRGEARAEADRILAQARAEAEQTVAEATEKAAAAEARLADADSHLAALEAEILAGARAEAERLTTEARDAAAVERHRATIKAEKAASAVKEANRAEIAELERAVAELRTRRATLAQDLEARTRELGGISEAIGDLLARMSQVGESAADEGIESFAAAGESQARGDSGPVATPGARAGDVVASEESSEPEESAPGEMATEAGTPDRGEATATGTPGEQGEEAADSDVVIDLTGTKPRVSGTGAPDDAEPVETPEGVPEGLPRWALVADADQSGHPSRTANLQVVADNTEAAEATSATSATSSTAVITDESAESAVETSHLSLARDLTTVAEPRPPESKENSGSPTAAAETVAQSAAPGAGTVVEAVPESPEVTTEVTDVVEEESVTLEVLDAPSPRPEPPSSAETGADTAEVEAEAEAFWNESDSGPAPEPDTRAADTAEAILEDPFLAALKGPESVEFDGRGRPGPDRPGRRRRRRR